ncbi:MAG: hypothetical protein NTZ50_15900, partial [Chloroflexi bacterium]|nr:hypothetical protein [Chloroflexota bacterium]
DRWSGLGLRRAFGAFSALKGRTSIQPGFVLKARPWQRRGADIRMFSGDPQVLPGRTTRSVFSAKQVIPSSAGRRNNLFRVGKPDGLSRYEKSFLEKSFLEKRVTA